MMKRLNDVTVMRMLAGWGEATPLIFFIFTTVILYFVTHFSTTGKSTTVTHFRTTVFLVNVTHLNCPRNNVFVTTLEPKFTYYRLGTLYSVVRTLYYDNFHTVFDPKTPICLHS